MGWGLGVASTRARARAPAANFPPSTPPMSSAKTSVPLAAALASTIAVHILLVCAWPKMECTPCIGSTSHRLPNSEFPIARVHAGARHWRRRLSEVQQQAGSDPPNVVTDDNATTDHHHHHEEHYATACAPAWRSASYKPREGSGGCEPSVIASMSPVERSVAWSEVGRAGVFRNDSAILALPEAPNVPLLVPVLRKAGSQHGTSDDQAQPPGTHRPDDEPWPPAAHRTTLSELDQLQKRASTSSGVRNWSELGEFNETLSLPPWPTRANISSFDAFDALTNGKWWRTCANLHRTKNRWFCSHFTKAYDVQWQDELASCYEPHANPIGRSDVRLVLDIGGAAGSFARGVRSRYGDSKIVVTGNRYIEDDHHLIYPFASYIAARGFPTAMFDKDSFLPFGDSSWDVVHSSWSYHSGFSRATLHEFYRVIRPGGFLMLRAIAAARHTLDNVLAFAFEHRWVCKRFWCSGNSNFLWCQVPGY